jgi:shikimate dehydrogenase
MYVPLCVPSEPLLEMTLRTLAMNGVKGVNVTLPYKEKAVEICDYVSDTAKEIGAVNTIMMHPEGWLAGDNTDAYGFRRSLWQARVDMQPNFKRAVVLGAGGAARAILVALKDEGCEEVMIVNRTLSRAEELIASIMPESEEGQPAPQPCKTKFTPIPWEAREGVLKEATLLVNTTSLGMKGQPPLEMNLEHLSKEAVVTDIVYNPLYTDLLKQADDRGNFTVDGLGMLLHQAVPGFTIWFDHKPKVSEQLRDYVVGLLNEKEGEEKESE